VRYRFIEQERRSYPVGRLCGVMQVSRSGFYAWRRRPKSNRTRQDEVLTQQIQCIHRQSRGIYGAPRIHAELCDQHVRSSRKRVARLMRLAGLEGKRKGSHKPKRTPSSTPTASNLLALSTSATQPNQIWVSDITYLRTAEGWELGPLGPGFARSSAISLLSSTFTPGVSWVGPCGSVSQKH
jgi:putative transposase